MTAIAQKVRTAQLRNGAHAYLLENHTNLTVDIVGFIEGGLFLEDPRRSGVANLCISMLDRGTRQRDQAAISEALESNGALLSHGLSRELVTLRARCLSEDLALLLEILGETLSAPTFPEDQLRIVREDAKAGLREIAFDTYARACRRSAELILAPEHPYAREALGREEILDSLARADLEAYHRKAVAGSRLWLAVVGDIEPDHTLALLEKHLGPLPQGEDSDRPAAAAARSEGERIGGEGETIERQPDEGRQGEGKPTERGTTEPRQSPRRDHIPIPDKEQVDIVFMRPGVARVSPEFRASALANFLLGGSFVSRLNQQLRDAQGLTYGAQSTIASGLHPGIWLAHIGVHPTNVERAVEAVIGEMRRFAEEGAGEDEVETARRHLTGSFPIRLETNRAVASVLLEGIRTGWGLDFIDSYAERVQAITREQVNAAARGLFNTADLVTVSAGTLPG